MRREVTRHSKRPGPGNLPRNVDVACEIRDGTDKAIAVWAGDVELQHGREVEKWLWLPRSQCWPRRTHGDDDPRIVLRIREWLAIKVGLVPDPAGAKQGVDA